MAKLKIYREEYNENDYKKTYSKISLYFKIINNEISINIVKKSKGYLENRDDFYKIHHCTK